ncbi:MAG: DeoR/GlpR family DNA-binding transcription regulator [Lachnospiraceae bacterium]|nr:DeoR/GlpR family DNA-binding transcription regulator [Lachnospiraceae bacterium]
MLTEQRFEQILAIVESRGSVTVTELMKDLDASESTIRRDLNTLDEEGLLTKVRGGAMSKNSFATRDDEVNLRRKRNTEEKISIGKYAASLIEKNDFVYIDAGTSTDLMLDYIKERDAIYVTNAVSHAMRLSGIGCTVFLLGGEFKHTTEAIVGEEALLSLEKYNFTKGFFGTNGITIKNGFTTPEVKEAMVKRQAMRNCKESFVLADDTKFGQISAVGFGAIDQATILTNRIPNGYKDMKNIKEVGK